LLTVAEFQQIFAEFSNLLNFLLNFSNLLNSATHLLKVAHDAAAAAVHGLHPP